METKPDIFDREKKITQEQFGNIIKNVSDVAISFLSSINFSSLKDDLPSISDNIENMFSNCPAIRDSPAFEKIKEKFKDKEELKNSVGDIINLSFELLPTVQDTLIKMSGEKYEEMVDNMSNIMDSFKSSESLNLDVKKMMTDEILNASESSESSNTDVEKMMSDELD